MKKFVVFLAVLFITAVTMAQVPQKMSYQAVIRTDGGQIVSNQYLDVEISVLQQSEDGASTNLIYKETHTAKTTSNGIINLEIGSGKTMNDFSKIDWGKGPYFIQSTTEVDGKSVIVNSQLLSVPYSLYSEKAKYAESFDETALQKIIDERVKKIIGSMNLNESGDDGKLPGRFSVSSSKSVRFSKGNLQYQASTNTWKFAENQFDFLGENNLHASETYTGWIDLFGWGTSGYKDKFPWMTSSMNSDYGDSDNDITSTEYDWGIYNAISNGGNQQGVWHLLTYAEWQYLLNSRKNASNLRSKATVCGVKGEILLPDDFVLPEGLTFSRSSNTYNSKEWEVMEDAGAVFLLAIEIRYEQNGTNILSNDSSWFHYWTSSIYLSSSSAYSINDYFNKYVGLAVRLVTE